MRVDGRDPIQWSDANTRYPRFSFSIMRLGSAVQTKGFGLRLCSPRERLIAACRSTSERKTPRCSRRWVSEAKKVSTALAQEQEVGVK